MYSSVKETLCIVECGDSNCFLPRFPQTQNIAHFSSHIRNPTAATSVQDSHFSPITSRIAQSILQHKQTFPELFSIMLMLVLPILPTVIDISCQQNMGVVQCLTSENEVIKCQCNITFMNLYFLCLFCTKILLRVLYSFDLHRTENVLF